MNKALHLLFCASLWAAITLLPPALFAETAPAESTKTATVTVRTSPLVKRMIESPEGCYFAYPHANGFLADGHTLVVARVNGKRTDYLAFNPVTTESTLTGSLANARMYYSVSETGLLATNVNNCVVVMDLAKGEASARVIFEAPLPWRPSMPDISPDGRTVVMDFHDYTLPQRHQIRLFEVDSYNKEGGRVLLEKPWLLNHVHRSPAVPEWILFSHEGQRVSDRMWAWHKTDASRGRPIFDQKAPDGLSLHVGHELAMHHKPAALAVAFGHSPGSPRGLYEVGFTPTATNPVPYARPLSPGARDWHCNISRDGRWAVVDTMGPDSDQAAPSDWVSKESESDIIAVNLRTGARQFLHRGTFLRAHPWHPHPHISPDGRWVIYNDARTQRVRALEIDQTALDAFFSSDESPFSDEQKNKTFLLPQAINAGDDVGDPSENNDAAAASPPLPWDMTALGKPPAVFPVSEADVPTAKGVRPVYFEGPDYQKKPTFVFAWIGLPDGASATNQVPGIVLVHGAGGTAFSNWVKTWNARGYAAIALDHNGGLPVGKYSNWKRNPRGGPARNDLDHLDAPLADQWMYHAVANTLLAHSLLASLPEVDAARIGITGISLGGTITSTVAGVDHRLKFAAPVYGCGHTADEVEDGSRFVGGRKGTPDQRAVWRRLWDPANYLPRAPSTLPILWVNGTNDFAFTLRSWQLSYRDAPGPRRLSLHVRMPHGHVAGEAVKEIRAFADSVVRGGKPLAQVSPPQHAGREASATYSSPLPLVSAELNYTRDTGRWQDRLWESVPATLLPDTPQTGRMQAGLPEGTSVYYFNVTDTRGLVTSSEHEALDSATASLR
ncbi:alpha/beta hydrolase [Opitutaceae bacterium TAV4]|nr:alpha/beta hydrolase [Opitutaceae bacterium TAV4]RRJ99295.1 alpha/beta hydrolase [Opitutaceae bacterium TAV3]